MMASLPACGCLTNVTISHPPRFVASGWTNGFVFHRRSKKFALRVT
jgi:hypothetical protein